jgi:hypothetical protein
VRSEKDDGFATCRKDSGLAKGDVHLLLRIVRLGFDVRVHVELAAGVVLNGVDRQEESLLIELASHCQQGNLHSPKTAVCACFKARMRNLQRIKSNWYSTELLASKSFNPSLCWWNSFSMTLSKTLVWRWSDRKRSGMFIINPTSLIFLSLGMVSGSLVGGFPTLILKVSLS